MDAKKRGVEVTEPGRPLVIDVEPLEIIEAPPAAAIRPIGSAVARRAASPAADPVLFAGEHPVDRRRRLDAERKRRSRAQQRETATATRRRRRFTAAAALIAIPCFAVAAAAFTYDRWSSTSAEVAGVGAAVDAVGSDVRRVGGTLSASMAGLGLSVAGVAAVLPLSHIPILRVPPHRSVRCLALSPARIIKKREHPQPRDARVPRKTT
ncbi:hypothetical protein GAY33_29535, partial [Azospirillum brasilense]|uniref:hypothetical protein n=1 Tax=Azospirillum argentinense TaxID=2970906 RepID=UPI003FD8AD27|nr:hypothetical protein [Azospirillum argentinense]